MTDALQTARDLALAWERDDGTKDGWVGTYSDRATADRIADSLLAAGYTVSTSRDVDGFYVWVVR